MPTLRGIVLRDEADTLIVQATPAEVQQFTRNAEVNVAGVFGARDPEHAAYPVVGPGEMLYTADGKVVGYVTEMSMHREMIDATVFGEARVWMRGVSRYELRVEGPVR